MTLLELVITAHRCRSTHHFIAIDALSLLNGKDADLWRNLMLKHHDKLLKGAKAPDAEFKDFKNHVLHISEGEWGGARDAAMDWYGRAVAALRAEKWSQAAYALGVLTHYYADPIQPFHTAQSEEEGAIHRALEWSIAKSRPAIEARIAERGYPVIEAGSHVGFVSDMVRAGAEKSHPHYQTLIDRYDIHAGVKRPEDGLDDTLLDLLADLIAYATAGVAVLFDRACAEAAVKPPKVDLDLPGYLAALDIPIRRITKKMTDAKDRRTVEAMYNELQTTGKVIKTLSADDKAIRKMHAKQVLRIPLKELDQQALKPLGVRHGQAGKSAPVDPSAKPAPAMPKPQKPARPSAAIIPIVSTSNEAQTPKPPPAKIDPKPEPKIARAAKAKAATPPEATPVSEKVLEEITEQVAKPAAIQAEAQSPAPEAEAPKAPTPTGTKAAAVSPKPPETVAADKSSQPSAAEREETQRLTAACPVVDAPSIGPKTAKRLETVDIFTIGDLMSADAEATATKLEVRYIKPDTVKDWQDQTGLMLAMPGLRVLDAQILVGAGIRSAKDLAKSSARSVLTAATSFLDTPSGSRVLWGAQSTVDENEVKSWINLAKSTAA